MADNFDQALKITQSTLRSIQRMGRKKLHASACALDRLQQASSTQKKLYFSVDPSLHPEGHLTNIASFSSLPSAQGKRWTLESLCKETQACVKCAHLAASRTQVVFGVGNPQAELMFVGEAPGADEDKQGEPFVGRAGRLLTRIIETMGFRRNEVYITNVLKCRPDMPIASAGNRKPKPEEVTTCFPWLHEQITLIKPRVLVALGITAAEGLLGRASSMQTLRGRWMEYCNIPVLVTYHPAYLLRKQSVQEKRKVWQDMLLVLEKLGRPISEKQKGYFLAHLKK